jgi:uncharacterized protein (TIGR00159 family)
MNVSKNMSAFYFITPLIEVVVMAIIFNYLLSFFWNTRSMDLMIGFLALLAIFGLSTLFDLPVLHKIMLLVVNVAAFGVIVIFQPELRMALSKINPRARRRRSIGEFDPFLEQLTNSVYRMAEKHIGAIIIIENADSLDEFAHNGVMLSSQFSSELLESIFMTSAPMHDGAVIIRQDQILAAACILPLAQNTQQLTKAMGTRHRAGLGISEITDSIVIIISEESGKVSIAREGIMTRGVKMDRFKGILRSIFNPTKASIGAKGLREWLKQ